MYGGGGERREGGSLELDGKFDGRVLITCYIHDDIQYTCDRV